MPCTVEQREQLRTVADAISSHPKCVGSETREPDAGDYAGWTIELTLASGTCPPGVLRALADERLHLREGRPRGTGYTVVASVR